MNQSINMSSATEKKRSAESSVQSAPKRRKPIPRSKKPLVKWKSTPNHLSIIDDIHFTSINCLQADEKKAVFADEYCVRVLQLNSLKLDKRTQHVQHNGAIRCLQYDHEKIITGGEDGKFKVWNALKQFKCDAEEDVAKGEGIEEVNTLQFNKQLLYLGTTKNIRVYDLEKMKLKWKFAVGEPKPSGRGRETEAIHVLKFDENYLFCSVDNATKMLDVRTNEIVYEFSVDKKYPCVIPSTARCLAFDDNELVCGYEHYFVKVWDIRQRCLKYIAPQKHTKCVTAMYMDAQKVITGGSDKKVIVWRRGGRLQDEISYTMPGTILSLQALSSSKLITGTGNGTISIFSEN